MSRANLSEQEPNRKVEEMNVAKLQKLKSQATQLLREHEALLTLSCLIATERAKLFERSREELALAGSVNKMQMYVQHEGQIVNELRRLLGTSVSNSQLLASLDSMKAAASKMVEGGKKTMDSTLQILFCNDGSRMLDSSYQTSKTFQIMQRS